MMKSEEENLIFDTSAVMKLARHYHGFERVEELFQRVRKGEIQGFLSPLTFYELIISFGQGEIEKSARVLDNLETAGFKTIGFDEKTARAAGMLRINYNTTNLSTVDCLILQTAIQENIAVITSDKEWLKVKEARVKVV